MLTNHTLALHTHQSLHLRQEGSSHAHISEEMPLSTGSMLYKLSEKMSAATALSSQTVFSKLQFSPKSTYAADYLS